MQHRLQNGKLEAISISRPRWTNEPIITKSSCSDFKMMTINFHIWAASWQNQQSECAPSEDSDQPGHPLSLIRVFAVRMKKPWVLSYPLSAQRRLWSDWADVQVELSLRWAHTHFVGFVTRRLILPLTGDYCDYKHFIFFLFYQLAELSFLFWNFIGKI